MFETRRFCPADFTLRIAVYFSRARILYRLLLCIDLLPSPGENDFFFSLEALVYESWHSESFNTYILNVYVFLKSFGNAYN